MKIQGKHTRTIWPVDGGAAVEILDQTLLPHAVVTRRLESVEAVAEAICTMRVRGAPLIGAAAAYGVALAMRAAASGDALRAATRLLGATRPTAVNLHWALSRMAARLAEVPEPERAARALAEANAVADEDVAACAEIGRHGLALLRALAEKRPGQRLNVLTHCNAGWLACVDWGTALSPIYAAHDAGLPVHVWVDETRPRNQGASLTAFELGAHGVPHTLIVDNAGGHLMQHGEVDACIVGADRVAANGDVANKIGTYLKALAATDNALPFYVAFPSSTFDASLASGDAIPIEERAAEEVTHMTGRLPDERLATVAISPAGTNARNPAFDVTPARLVTALITERGVVRADRASLAEFFER